MKPIISHVDESTEYFFREGCFILETLPKSTNNALSVARARVRPGVRTRLHALNGVTEHYVIISGKGRMFLGEDETGQVVGPNAVVVIPPTVAQSVENTGDTDLIFLAICTPGFAQECYVDLEQDKG